MQTQPSKIKTKTKNKNSQQMLNFFFLKINLPRIRSLCIFMIPFLNKSNNTTRLFSYFMTFLQVCRHSDGRRAWLYKALLRQGSESWGKTTKSSQPSGSDSVWPVPINLSGLFKFRLQTISTLLNSTTRWWICQTKFCLSSSLLHR